MPSEEVTKSDSLHFSGRVASVEGRLAVERAFKLAHKVTRLGRDVDIDFAVDAAQASWLALFTQDCSSELRACFFFSQPHLPENKYTYDMDVTNVIVNAMQENAFQMQRGRSDLPKKRLCE